MSFKSFYLRVTVSEVSVLRVEEDHPAQRCPSVCNQSRGGCREPADAREPPQDCPRE